MLWFMLSGRNELPTEELSRPFGDTEAYYATIGYRFGKFLPHITFASIDGEASAVSRVLITGQLVRRHTQTFKVLR